MATTNPRSMLGRRVHMCLRLERNLDAFSGLGMNRIAVEEFEFFR